jgi:ATP-dependent protease ClpP protease subunit
MLEILVQATGKSAAVIRKKLLPPSDVYLSAEEMVEIGAADYILQ